MTTLAIYFSGDVTSAYALFYFWPCIYAFYFFCWREALLNVALRLANYMASSPSPGFPTELRQQRHRAPPLMTVGTMTVAGGSLIALRGRVDQLFERLTDAARTDVLTGLPNRVGLHDSLERELERAAPEQRPVSILMLDLDRFKQLNEKLGLDVGDQVLRRLGAQLEPRRASSTPSRDPVARSSRSSCPRPSSTAPSCSPRSCWAIRRGTPAPRPNPAHRLDRSLDLPGTRRRCYRPLSAADRALYAAKALGRDRAVIYSPEVTRPSGRSQASAASRTRRSSPRS